ncbi:MAG: hypothetical protein AVDCRST_MAG93-1573 [uncultured Chloroflexia bacterium]|uniref:Transposase IS4-like domain-containing protein n=1 Tax=uncultured Chloroflexia bacterium TaxID=1672391 RepID=A0A6J4ID90_9CHLR|nr:MAG: hypothetical protein AVDCRST_MAG93-1573 [uncultured Chloroflexia bacterium]
MQTSPSKLTTYASNYRDLFGDQRLFDGFVGTLQGILGSQSLHLSKIANASSLLTGQHAERRVRRLVHGDNQRAPLSAEALTERLTKEGVSKLAWEDEVLLILDESDLRKPFATCMEHLDTVRSLDGELVPGFRTLNVLGIGASGQRAILYHHSFSASAPGFESASVEYRWAMDKVTNALRGVGVGRLLWVIDRAGDDLKLMKHLHEAGSSFVIGVQHVNRKCKHKGRNTSVAQAVEVAPVLGEATLERRLLDPSSKRHRNQHVPVQLAGTEVELRESLGFVVSVAQVKSPLNERGWLLLSNLRLHPDEEVAVLQRLLSVYRQRWAIEDLFAWTKGALGWESVRLMSFGALRTLVAFAWLGAAFLYDLSSDAESQGVQFLAQLGGAQAGNKKPGMRRLATGLRHLASYLLVATYAPQFGGDDALLTLAHLVLPAP